MRIRTLHNRLWVGEKDLVFSHRIDCFIKIHDDLIIVLLGVGTKFPSPLPYKNMFAFNAELEQLWQIDEQSDFNEEGNSFSEMHYSPEKGLTTRLWSGERFDVDLSNGAVTFTYFDRW